MLDIPYEVKELFKEDSVKKNFRVHLLNERIPDITNEQIMSESVTFTESLCSKDQVEFGLCEASCLEFETVGIGNITGEEISAQIEIDCSSLGEEWCQKNATYSDDVSFPYYAVPYGVFVVEESKRKAGKLERRAIKAYSSIANTEWKISDINMLKLSEYAWKTQQTLYGTPDDFKYLVSPDFFSNWHEANSRNSTEDTRTFSTTFHNFKIDNILYSAVRIFIRVKTFTPFYYMNTFYSYGIQSICDKNYKSKCDAFFNFLDNVGIDSSSIISSIPSNEEIVSNGYLHIIIKNDNDGNIATMQEIYVANKLKTSKEDIFNVKPSKAISRFGLNYSEDIDTNNSSESWIYKAPIYLNEYLIDSIKVTGEYLEVVTENNKKKYERHDDTLFEINMDNRFLLSETHFFKNSDEIKDVPSQQLIKINTARTNVKCKKITFNWITDIDTETTVNETLYTLNLNDFKKIDWQKVIQGSFESEGAMGYYARDGKFLAKKFDTTFLFPSISLYPNYNLFPSNSGALITKNLYSSAWWEDSITKPYGSITATYKNTKDEEVTTIYYLVDIEKEEYLPSDFQDYDISNSYFVAEKQWTEEEMLKYMKNIADAIKFMQYTPCSITMRGLPYLEAGDRITVHAEGVTFETYALRRTLKGVQSLTDIIESN